MSSASTILITGAARRLGAAIARHLAAQGHGLVLHFHRSGDEAETLAAELRAVHGVAVHLVGADFSEPRALGDFWCGLPPVTDVIFNAATYARDTLATLDAAKLRQQLAVNLEAPLVLAQGFMAQLAPDMRGSITVLGDGALGWSVAPPFFSYAASKHAWVGLIELLAAAVAPQARANLLALPPILPNTGEDDALFARLAERAPLQRTGDPEELLAAIDYLLAAPGVTGQVLSLANGMGLLTARPSGA